MTTCLLCSNILPRYPHFLPAFLPSVLPSCISPVVFPRFRDASRISLGRRRCARRRREAWIQRTPTGLGSPCRSWGTSSTRGTSSRPKCSCCRRSWPTTKGTFQSEETSHGGISTAKLTLTLCLCSEEAEDEMVTPSPSPSPELRTRARSSAQPESGIKRLYVSLQIHSSAHENTQNIALHALSKGSLKRLLHVQTFTSSRSSFYIREVADV